MGKHAGGTRIAVWRARYREARPPSPRTRGGVVSVRVAGQRIRGRIQAGPADGAQRAALPGWLVAHAVVLLALLATWWYRHGLPQTGVVPGAPGLFAWDSAWYRTIAQHGYRPLSPESVRIFPLLAMTAALTQALDPGRLMVAAGSARS